MAQFYPDGMCEVNLSRVRESGELTIPPQENFDTAAMHGSMQEILAENLGHYVVCEFQIGTQAMAKKEGILYAVGRGYVALFDEIATTFAVCDVFSIKFVTFYMPGQRPGRSGGSSGIPTVSVPGVDGVPISNYGIGSIGRAAPPQSGLSSGGSRTMGGR